MTTKPTTTALAVHTPMPVSTIADLVKAGELLARSGMFDLNDASGFVVAATCHQQGISLMEFHRSYHIVEGKPSMRADAMLAELRKRGGKYTITANTVEKAAATFEFEGQTYKVSYTMDDAKRTGDCYKKDGKTLKFTWEKRPDDMLWARMISRAVRRLCPEINAGIYTSEEVSDFDDNVATRAPGGEPVPITAKDAAARATVVIPEIVDDEPVIEPPDATLCPIGGDGVKGKPWSEFSDGELNVAVSLSDPALTLTYKAAIRFEIDKRKEGGEG